MSRFRNTKYAPYWWEAAPPKNLPSVNIPEEVDVAIVGAGFAGLSAGLTALRAGRSVALFDAGDPGAGASTRNGGICSGSLRYSFPDLIEKFGLNQAIAIYREGMDARDNLIQFCQDENIESDLKITGRFTGAVVPEHLDKLKRQAEAMNTHLDLGCEVIEPESTEKVIASPLYHGGIIQPDIGGYHPGKFHAAMVQLVQKEGGIIAANCPVESIEKYAITSADSFSSTLITAQGHISARHIIVTTNGYTNSFQNGQFDTFLRKRLIPVASAIIVTDEISPDIMKKIMPSLRMYGDTLNIHSYFRPTPDGKRILYGSRTPEIQAVTEVTAKFLADRLAGILPQTRPIGISHCWRGNVAFNMDMMPRLFDHDDIHYAVGFCGSGTVWARWLGRQVAEKALGVANQNSVFDGPPPSALPFYDGRPYFIPMALRWYRFLDWLAVWRKS